MPNNVAPQKQPPPQPTWLANALRGKTVSNLANIPYNALALLLNAGKDAIDVGRDITANAGFDVTPTGRPLSPERATQAVLDTTVSSALVGRAPRGALRSGAADVIGDLRQMPAAEPKSNNWGRPWSGWTPFRAERLRRVGQTLDELDYVPKKEAIEVYHGTPDASFLDRGQSLNPSVRYERAGVKRGHDLGNDASYWTQRRAAANEYAADALQENRGPANAPAVIEGIATGRFADKAMLPTSIRGDYDILNEALKERGFDGIYDRGFSSDGADQLAIWNRGTVVSPRGGTLYSNPRAAALAAALAADEDFEQ